MSNISASSDSNDSTGYGNFGSIKSLKVMLKNVDGSAAIDISLQTTEIAIYEDIFSKTIFGTMGIKDPVNIMNGLENKRFFPLIVGEEFIEIECEVYGFPLFKRRFAVNAIKDIAIDAKMTTRTYMIEFCSEEHLLDSVQLVQKSYQDQISNMVEDVLKTYLYVDKELPNGKKKKSYDIQPTKDKQNIVIPRLSPLETMDFFARRSIAKDTFQSSSYLFFENKDGFNFCDIEYLIKRGKDKYYSNTPTYQYFYGDQKIVESAGSAEPAIPDDQRAFKTVISMTQKHKFDTIEKITGGYFESDVILYDFLNKDFSNTTFQFINEYKKISTLGAGGNSAVKDVAESAYPENSIDFINQVTSQNTNGGGVLSAIAGILGLLGNKPAPKHTKTFFMVSDSSQPNTYLDTIYTNRASYMTRFSQNMFTAETYGDPNITAGDVITLDLVDPIGLGGSGENYKRNPDRFLSGYFMITSIQHKITPDSYLMKFDMFKNGFSNPVVTTKNGTRPEGAAGAYINAAAPAVGQNKKVQ